MISVYRTTRARPLLDCLTTIKRLKGYCWSQRFQRVRELAFKILQGILRILPSTRHCALQAVNVRKSVKATYALQEQGENKGRE